MALEVTNQLAPAELTSLSTLKRRLRVASLGSADDDLLRDLIREASAEVVSYCRRPFARAQVIETGLRPDGGSVFLSLTPVVEVHSVSRGGEPILDFEVEDPDAGIISAGSGGGILAENEMRWWNDPFQGVARETYTVDYTGGYLTPQDPPEGQPAPPRTLPFDLEAAVISMVGYAYSPDADDRKIKSVKVEDITYQYETGSASGASTMDSALSITDRLDRWKRVI